MSAKSLYRAVCNLMLFQVLVTAAPLSKPDYLQPYPTTPRNLTADEVMRDLGGQLSSGTTIFGPGDAAYPNATKRWNILEVPDIQVVVQVGQELDVAKIVCSTSQPLHISDAKIRRSDIVTARASNS